MAFLKTAALYFVILAAAAGPGFAPQGFDFTGPSNRVLTPNGDGFNDSVTFRFSNPRDSTGSIRIYDIRGREVRSLAISVGDTARAWDGRSNGQTVTAGIYIYVLSIEQRTYSGAVLVVR